MVDESRETTEQAKEEASAPRSYTARNWPLVAFFVGLLAAVVAVVYWQGIAKPGHRRDYFESLQRASQLVETHPYQARLALARLLPGIPLAPETGGEVYFLLGRANEKVADNPDLEPERAVQYRQAALEALFEADKLRVPEALTLPLRESLGRMLVAVGQPKQLSLALSTLTDALRRRDEIAWVIGRRELEAALQRHPPRPDDLVQIAERWRRVPEAPADLADLAQRASEAARDGDIEGLRTLLISPGALPTWPENQEARVLDIEADTVLDVDGPDKALAMLEERREWNDLGRSRLLASLAFAATASTPAMYRDAITWATRRVELDSIEPAERDKARLALAEILTAANEPMEARRILGGLTGTSATDHRAMFLLAKSYLDEAERLRRMSDVDWIKSNPSLQKYSLWLKQTTAAWSDRSSQVSPWIRAAASTVSRIARPGTIKDGLESGAYHRAVASFQRLLQAGELSDELAAEARLWLGVSYAALSRFSEAESEFHEVSRLIGASPLDQAAQFYRADLLRREGKVAQSLDAFRKASETVQTPSRYDNPYLRPSSLRDMFIENWGDYHGKKRDFASAVSIAQLYQCFRGMKVIEPGQPDDFYASSNVALGRLVFEQAQLEEIPKAKQLEKEARAHFREAGRAYLAVAKAREGADDYPAILWLAATNLFEGHAFQDAIPAFEEFLKAHVGGPRDFPARIYLARSYMAQLDYHSARKFLEDSLREERSAVDRFRGRILLAQCYMEIARSLASDEGASDAKKQIEDAAEQLLLRNVSGQNQELEPSAAEWRESLFVLGQILFETGRHDEAIPRFTEYVRRYPDEAESIDAENYLGEAYLASAAALEKRIAAAGSERERAKLREEHVRKLEQSLSRFHRLVSRLTQAADAGKIPPRQDLLLGNALFKIGRIHAMLGRGQEALDTFEDLAYRYQDRPECLAAYVEMSSAFRDLNRPADAQSSLRQALWVLDRIDDNAFARSDRNRDEIRKQIESLLANP